MVRTRIAPSPTGFPHVGTIYQALFDAALVKKHGGSFVLRLEDTDQKRFVAGSEEIIYQSLDWVGLKIDEGPREGGAFGPYRQSERLPIYQKYAEALLEKGYAYYCFCSPERLSELRQRQESAHQPTLYDKACRDLDPGESSRRAATENHVVRMKVPPNQTIVVTDSIRGEIRFESNLIDDQVLIKSDGFPTYHLALVVDDHLMGITHTVRGDEWLSSYPKHKLLYDFFGWEMPVFTHLPLLKNPDGSKISKRHGHTSVAWYREQGILPQTLINFLSHMVWNHPDGKEIYSFDEFAQLFEFKDLSIAGPRFDLKKLEWMNGEYLRAMSDEQLTSSLLKYISQQAGDSPLKSITTEQMAPLAPLIKERIKKLSELGPLAGFLFTDEVKYEEGLEIDRGYLDSAARVLEKLSSWQSSQIEAVLRQLAQDLKIKPGELFTSLRNAVAGAKVSPPLFESLAILGKERTLRRLRRFLS